MVRIFPLATVVVCLWASTAGAQQAPPIPPVADRAPYFRDRGTGLPLSPFGIYIRRGEVIVYPFYEYYNDDNFEYKPEEFGAVGDVDFRGRYRAHEVIFLFAYGLRDNLAFEFEVAGISARMDKAADDPSTLPARIEESGLGDVEGQIRWRWNNETDRRPEFFSYTEFVVPHAESKPLIGTPGWEVKFGTGLIRGFRWGTMTARGAIEYSGGSSSQFDIGEYAIEYLRRLSPRWRVYVGLEGTQDELSAIGELQWHLGSRAIVKMNLGRGLTSKAIDWAPEVGVLFKWPTRSGAAARDGRRLIPASGFSSR
jgi:hypothetical protein